MIVVIAILAILAAILIPSLTSYLEQATMAKEQSNARSSYSAVVLLEAVKTTPVTGDDVVPADFPNCEYDVDEGVVTTFACTYGTRTYSAPDFAKP